MIVVNDRRGDFDLIVKADGKQLARQTIGGEGSTAWANIDVDLSTYAGKTVDVELINQANGWRYEAAYWSEITVTTK